MAKKKFGAAFDDSIIRTKKTFGHFNSRIDQNQDWQDNFIPYFDPENRLELSIWRIIGVTILTVILFFGLFLRLFHLQVIQGDYNRDLADSNRIQYRVIHAPRGVIYDRNGVVLAESNPGFRLEGKFISRDEALKLEVSGNASSSKLEIDTVRSYPQGEISAHILGYVGEINSEELKQPELRDYKAGDKIGRAGIEQIYERYLKGLDGAEIIEVDSTGKKLRVIRRAEPTPGDNLFLSIDSGLQLQATQALRAQLETVRACCGAVVAENPTTGEVLTMVSLPSFDGNAFTNSSRGMEVSGYFGSRDSPLINRSISGTYPPGSTFKIVSALAGLITHKIDANTEIEDTGIVHLGPYSFANWYFTQYGKKEGMVNLVKALQRSNDIYFYRVGEWVGEKVLGDAARTLGMGKALGIDLPGEVDGLIPSDEWKRKTYDEVWFPGDNLHMAIGQGFLLTTPIQILKSTSFIASDGKIYKSQIVTKITKPDNSLVKEIKPVIISQGIYELDDIQLIKEGLSRVTKEGGTAWPFFNFSVPTSGKTGTAEFGDPNGRTHAWYTSYAPSDNPQISLTVLVEAGGEGSSVAAPVARKIYEWYFKTNK